MEKRRNSNPRGSSEDSALALVKAAAWAWYQRGSGSEGKPMPEYDPNRTFPSPKPSRYKLEAINAKAKVKTAQELANDEDDHQRNTKISLLDTYEVERISRQLDYYIERSNRFLEGDRTRRRVAPSPEKEASCTKTTRNTKKENKKRGKYWFWPRNVMACGLKDYDVVERGSVVGVAQRRRQLPEEKHVAKGKCRPRTTHG